jgi:hypothetical protein
VSSLPEHPTVIKIESAGPAAQPKRFLDETWVRKLVLEAGADGVGFVSIDRPEIQDQRADIERAMPSCGQLRIRCLRCYLLAAGRMRLR